MNTKKFQLLSLLLVLGTAHGNVGSQWSSSTRQKVIVGATVGFATICYSAIRERLLKRMDQKVQKVFLDADDPIFLQKARSDQLIGVYLEEYVKHVGFDVKLIQLLESNENLICAVLLVNEKNIYLNISKDILDVFNIFLNTLFKMTKEEFREKLQNDFDAVNTALIKDEQFFSKYEKTLVKNTEYSDAVKRTKKLTGLYVKSFPALLGHELRHIQQGDTMRKKVNRSLNYLYGTLIPTTWLTAFACEKFKIPFIVSLPLGVIGGLNLAADTTAFLQHLVSKYNEYDADMYCSTNPQVVARMAEFFNEFPSQKIPDDFNKHWFLREIAYFVGNYKDVHPHSLTRVEYLTALATKLEKEQTQVAPAA